MARLPCWPTSHDKLPSTQPASSRSAHLILVPLFLLLLIHLSSFTFAQQYDLSSIPFLSDQPQHIFRLPLNTSLPNVSYITVELSVHYLTTVTILTSNAPTFYAVLTGTAVHSGWPAVTPAHAPPSPGVRSVLLGPQRYNPTTFASQCAGGDTNGTGVCSVMLVMGGAPSTDVYYSVYTATLLQYYMQDVNVGQPRTLTYYAKYINTSDLNVQFDLTWANLAQLNQQVPLCTAMLVSTERSLFTPLYPSPPLNGSVFNPTADQSYVVTPSSSAAAGLTPGLYLVGLWWFSSCQQYPASRLLLTPSYVDPASSSGSVGYTVLSVMALILSSSVAAIILFRVALLCRRRNQLIVLSRAEAATHVFELPVEGQAVVVHSVQRQHGATEAEIAALPEMVYVKNVSGEGDEGDDAPRCTMSVETFSTMRLRIRVKYVATRRLIRSLLCLCVLRLFVRAAVWTSIKRTSLASQHYVAVTSFTRIASVRGYVSAATVHSAYKSSIAHTT